MPDLGFPNPWLPKDTVTLVFGVLAILVTIVAVHFQSLADEQRAVSSLPDTPKDIQEVGGQYQQRIARERAERRAALARGAMYGRISTAILVLSVVAGIVSSITYLAVLGLLSIAAVAFYGLWVFRHDDSAIRQRVEILNTIWDIYAKSTGTQYVFDSRIYATIEAVFKTPLDKLNDLDHNSIIALIQQMNELASYIEEQKKRNNQEIKVAAKHDSQGVGDEPT